MNYILMNWLIGGGPVALGRARAKAQLPSPLNPFRDMLLPRMMAASCELFENVTRRYGKPEWGIKETRIFGMPVPIDEEIVLTQALLQSRPFQPRREGDRPPLRSRRC